MSTTLIWELSMNCKTVDVFNDDGTMSAEAGIYQGEDRFVVRKKFAADLEAAGFIEKIEDYKNNVGRSERTNAVVEPRLSLQWYVDMKALAGPALAAVESDDIEFFPKPEKPIPPLDGKHQGLVYFTTTLVGTQGTRMVLQ